MENKVITYSAAIEELEGIVRRMQSDEVDIDSLAKYTRRALELVRICKDKLTKTDEEIKKCLEELS